MSNVRLVWVTPNAEDMIAYMARVSNPSNQNNQDTAPKLLKYLMKHKHWSPFEMVNVCMEIETTRDIARQIIRHRSFSFQEFSQRYADVNSFEKAETRMQDHKNRQNSLPNNDEALELWWQEQQARILYKTQEAYEKALEHGIAKEVARKILPEGLTMSRMYMNGTLRSWIHYCDIRTDPATQKEHREVADQAQEILRELFPNVFDRG